MDPLGIVILIVYSYTYSSMLAMESSSPVGAISVYFILKDAIPV